MPLALELAAERPANMAASHSRSAPGTELNCTCTIHSYAPVCKSAELSAGPWSVAAALSVGAALSME